MAKQITVCAFELQPGKDRLVAVLDPSAEPFPYPYPYVVARTNHMAITEVDWFDKDGNRHNRLWGQQQRVTVLRDDGPERAHAHVPAYRGDRDLAPVHGSWKAMLVSVAAVIAAAVGGALIADPAWIWHNWWPR